MCLGHTHAISGAVTGLAAGSLILHLPAEGLAELTAFTAGWATMPDLDTTGSCAARSFGLFSEAFAWCVEKIARGHRHATHTAIGVAVITLLTWLASWRATSDPDWVAAVPLALLLGVALAAGVRAMRVHGHLADVLALAAAGAIAVSGTGLGLVLVACALGCATHLGGDMLTVEGIPLAWPFSRKRIGLPAPIGFVTGTWRETWVLAPALIVGLGLLAWHAAGAPAVDLAPIARR